MHEFSTGYRVTDHHFFDGGGGVGGGGVVRVVKFSYANIFYMRLMLQTIFEQGS